MRGAELLRVFAGRCGLILGGFGLALGRAPVRGHCARDRTEGGGRRRKGAIAPSGLTTARSGGRSPSTALLLGDFGARCARRRGGGGCPSRTRRDRAVIVRAAIRRRGRSGGTTLVARRWCRERVARVCGCARGWPRCRRAAQRLRQGRRGGGQLGARVRSRGGERRGGRHRMVWTILCDASSACAGARARASRSVGAGGGRQVGLRRGAAALVGGGRDQGGVHMGGAAPPLSSRGGRVSPCAEAHAGPPSMGRPAAGER